MEPTDLRPVFRQFALQGDYVSAEPYGSGHINDTFAVTADQGGTRVRYLFQRINDRIFQIIPALMENVERVTSHLQKRLAAEAKPDASRRALTLIPTREGNPFLVDGEARHWRAYVFIEKATGHDIIRSEAQAREAARAFGEFQRLLADLPGGPLFETIPDFHHTPKRFAAFEAALEADACNRAILAKDEIDFLLARRDLPAKLLDAHAAGALPLRATHNDTKLNNVLLDDATDEAICVIDFDTLMPGLACYDFGDLVRTSTSPAAEDETDLAKVTFRLSMFRALAEGFVGAAREALTTAEIESLPLGGKMMTFENAIRFLTDFLQGDTYFKVKRERHNLDRCRTQCALVRSMEDQWDEMTRCMEEIACAS